jgi:hypothetical protein
VNVAKRYLIAAAAHNLGRVLWKLFGVGKPKALQGEGGLAALVQLIMLVLLVHWRRLVTLPRDLAIQSCAFVPAA